ncbi:MAG TPA: hypothetical protein VFU02_05250 [Polyangiaceae bacterium]|nr:hypothetical protein [Polyangiaceae bacterium]
MNFYGHAVFAAATHSDSAFVLGAMLPDFISILGARPPRLELGLLARGVAFHHRTDAVFHDSATFRRLQAQAASHLSSRGVRRGPTRAVAHVGVELLIDAAIAGPEPDSARSRSTAADESYLAALELGASPHAALVWRPPDEPERFMGLCQRLRHAGVERFRVDAEQAMVDLARILARRPRLALSEHETRTVSEWANQAFVVVKAELPALLEELENRLHGHEI